jgi:hypothetical protein
VNGIDGIKPRSTPEDVADRASSVIAGLRAKLAAKS